MLEKTFEWVRLVHPEPTDEVLPAFQWHGRRGLRSSLPQ